MRPEDLMTMGEVAAWQQARLSSLHKRKSRHADWPEPWKRGLPGEPDLYLRSDLERYFRVHPVRRAAS